MVKCNHMFTGDKNFLHLAPCWSPLPDLVSKTSAAYLNRNSSFMLTRTPILCWIVYLGWALKHYDLHFSASCSSACLVALTVDSGLSSFHRTYFVALCMCCLGFQITLEGYCCMLHQRVFTPYNAIRTKTLLFISLKPASFCINLYTDSSIVYQLIVNCPLSRLHSHCSCW
jgi:hypothetical protein